MLLSPDHPQLLGTTDFSFWCQHAPQSTGNCMMGYPIVFSCLFQKRMHEPKETDSEFDTSPESRMSILYCWGDIQPELGFLLLLLFFLNVKQQLCLYNKIIIGTNFVSVSLCLAGFTF